ncbi:hypothetical protein ASPVEDRAFT_65179 [Aspergillus versicolor CBS 583.65]|uniref:Cyclase n=1 Tax=Aspergillus versicolor CBS 583.65 TaxID=1036611 RepID=A0A1L9PYG6_ASPVE|nr:uncharacterized protein ASPVEDRAFT_65179 [Aspergillus versicolor CBS 583.65]OJJ06482.1 hypothetical protein ASPVEDRAFT_65179 [Aspergillus versicolor CBS 583.65]
MLAVSKIPRFDQLPLREGDPPFSAWGLWKKPEYGSLNYLTDTGLLQAAREEIQTGERVSLDLPLDLIDPPLLGRKGFKREIVNKAPRVINDDVITFNTQGSSQWDSFRHFAYQKHGKFYNGVTQGDIHEDQSSTVGSSSLWSKGLGGIVGRGVLVDYASWASENGVQYDPLSTQHIPLEAVKLIAREKGIEFRQGDILFLRTGFVKGYRQLSKEQREKQSKVSKFPGLRQSRDTVEWLWERQFAAVTSDSPAFESIPPADPEYMLHPILLSGWGTPIGELFDLDDLAEGCARLSRWSFFITSAPLNYTGAVATPPNAIAIF